MRLLGNGQEYQTLKSKSLPPKKNKNKKTLKCHGSLRGFKKVMREKDSSRTSRKH